MSIHAEVQTKMKMYKFMIIGNFKRKIMNFTKIHSIYTIKTQKRILKCKKKINYIQKLHIFYLLHMYHLFAWTNTIFNFAFTRIETDQPCTKLGSQ